jgi:predicted nucleic acid-binding Zn ribbon protein
MSERGESPARIRDLLGDVGQRLGLVAAVETGMVWSRWEHIVGPAIAQHAEPSSLKGGVLRVRADSPAWATEIGYLGDQIRAAANRVVGVELVREVRVWTGPGPPSARAATSGLRRRVTARSTPSDPSEALERARQAWGRTSRPRE